MKRVLAAAVLGAVFASAAVFDRQSFVPRDPPGDNYRLIDFGGSAPPVWLPADVVIGFAPQWQDVPGDFKELYEDITSTRGQVVAQKEFISYPTEPHQEEAVKGFIDSVDQDEVQGFARGLTDHFSRMFQTQYGRESAQWVQAQCEQVIEEAGREADISVEVYEHSGWPQDSVFVKFNGTSSAASDIVIIGAHQDSLNQRNPSNGRAPGGDDDGSGSVSIFEVFRVLANAGFQPHRPLEIHFYGAEEYGMWGSQEIVNTYRARGDEVYGMLQLDMNSYRPDANTRINLVNVDTNSQLTAFLAIMIDTYADLPRQNVQRSLSDHKSWHDVGYPASHCKESSFPSFYHTEHDTYEEMNFELLHEFTKIAMGFAVELGSSTAPGL